MLESMDSMEIKVCLHDHILLILQTAWKISSD